MFGCIITGSLCSIVSVLSCMAACYVVADCQLQYEIKALLLSFESFWHQKPTKIKLKVQNPNTDLISTIKPYVLLSLLSCSGWEMGNVMLFHFLPFPNSHSHALFHPHGTRVVFRFPRDSDGTHGIHGDWRFSIQTHL